MNDREKQIYILETSLRQHMQELSWSCLAGFLPVNLGFSSRSTCISSFLKRFGATVLRVFAMVPKRLL